MIDHSIVDNWIRMCLLTRNMTIIKSSIGFGTYRWHDTPSFKQSCTSYIRSSWRRLLEVETCTTYYQ